MKHRTYMTKPLWNPERYIYAPPSVHLKKRFVGVSELPALDDNWDSETRIPRRANII